MPTVRPPTIEEVKLMVKCLKCGGEVTGPAKEWDMHPKDGRGPALHIKHFSCPSCGKKFRLATKLAGA
jgi:DNA-directed RNA polymerase subunit RPC12/RpoP